jgi:anaerobic selenocysteine-containing dehydrogenase
MTTVPSFCRICLNYCPIVVEVENGRAVSVAGDRANDVWNGHSCIKGRKQHERLYSTERLLHSLKRAPDGTFQPIAINSAMDEIAARIQSILAEHGPRSVAFYIGTGFLSYVLMPVFAWAFTRAVGLRMFTPNTIDKPGKAIAKALHGRWSAPSQGYDEPDVALLIGNNPIVTYEGTPTGNPSWLTDRLKQGMNLIVIDPRRTETARRATLFLQAVPGQDAPILAAMLRIIIEEKLYDSSFVAEEVTGLDDLRRAVAPFAPEVVAARAGIAAADLIAAGRAFGRAKRGYAFAGTGPNLSGPGTLIEYLILCLETICGHWLREGEQVKDVVTLFPTPVFKAQAEPPRPARGAGGSMRVRGLTETPAGFPTAALADEMLLEGEGQVRALISLAGNPAAAWPNQQKVLSALESLDLMVQIDPWMSHSSQVADYVIAPKLPLETADISQWQDWLGLWNTGFGPLVSHGQYTEAVVEPPAGSDVIEDWEFLYGLAQRMGVDLRVETWAYDYAGIEPFDVDMKTKPTSDELFELLTKNSRIPLTEVKRHPHGQRYPEPAAFVQPKDPNWPHRLDVANSEMLVALDAIGQLLERSDDLADTTYPFRLVSRRTRGMYNSTVNDGVTTGGRTDNPAFLCRDDLDQLGLMPGDLVEIRSAVGTITAIVEVDDSLRRGMLSMAHGFGSRPSTDLDAVRRHGSNVGVLIADDIDFDPYSGQPRMSNVPVSVRRQVM